MLPFYHQPSQPPTSPVVVGYRPLGGYGVRPQTTPDFGEDHSPTLKRIKVPQDILLDYTWMDKLTENAKTAFVRLPKAIYNGLKGSEDYSFSDMMMVAKVPYYLGGVFLTLSFLLGGNKAEGIRQGAAVVMYLLGRKFTDGMINTVYRKRYGLDLTMMYRSKTGQIEQVFGSADFPRFDLLTPHQYRQMGHKMGIPDNIHEQDGAVREQAKLGIIRARTLKLIIGNLVAAIGAGYIARSNKWLGVPKMIPNMRKILANPRLGAFSKLAKTVKAFSAGVSLPFMERLNVVNVPFWRKAVVYGTAATVLGTALFTWFKGIPQKVYDEPGPKPKTILSPIQQFMDFYDPSLTEASFMPQFRFRSGKAYETVRRQPQLGGLP